MFTNTPSVSPDALVTAADVAVIVAGMNGKFDTQIKELREAKAALDTSNGIVKSVAAAARLEAAAAAMMEAAEKYDIDVKAREAAAVARETTVSELADALKTREVDVLARESALAAGIKKAAADEERTQKKLDAVKAELMAGQEKLAEERAAFAIATADFNAKLAALKV